jgi:hypothetical protein
MFDNDNTPDETPSGGSGRPDRPFSPSVEALLARIRERLEPVVPQGMFIRDSWLAEQLHMTPKTLCNRRAQDKLRYPKPMHPGGCRSGLHPRSTLIDWLALEELRHILGPGSRGS